MLLIISLAEQVSSTCQYSLYRQQLDPQIFLFDEIGTLFSKNLTKIGLQPITNSSNKKFALTNINMYPVQIGPRRPQVEGGIVILKDVSIQFNVTFNIKGGGKNVSQSTLQHVSVMSNLSYIKRVVNANGKAVIQCQNLQVQLDSVKNFSNNSKIPLKNQISDWLINNVFRNDLPNEISSKLNILVVPGLNSYSQNQLNRTISPNYNYSFQNIQVAVDLSLTQSSMQADSLILGYKGDSSSSQSCDDFELPQKRSKGLNSYIGMSFVKNLFSSFLKQGYLNKVKFSRKTWPVPQFSYGAAALIQISPSLASKLNLRDEVQLQCSFVQALQISGKQQYLGAILRQNCLVTKKQSDQVLISFQFDGNYSIVFSQSKSLLSSTLTAARVIRANFKQSPFLITDQILALGYLQKGIERAIGKPCLGDGLEQPERKSTWIQVEELYIGLQEEAGMIN